MNELSLPTTGAEARLLGGKRYFTGKPCKHGHVSQRSAANGNCIVCDNTEVRLRLRRMHEADPSRMRRYRLRQKVSSPVGGLLRSARKRAKQRGILFSITKADLTMGEACPCCMRAFLVIGEAASASDSSPSVDRVDHRGGYVPGNVAVICWRCNRLKNDASASELRTIADWMDRAGAGGDHNVIHRDMRGRGNITLKEISK